MTSTLAPLISCRTSRQSPRYSVTPSGQMLSNVRRYHFASPPQSCLSHLPSQRHSLIPQHQFRPWLVRQHFAEVRVTIYQLHLRSGHASHVDAAVAVVGVKVASVFADLGIIGLRRREALYLDQEAPPRWDGKPVIGGSIRRP